MVREGGVVKISCNRHTAELQWLARLPCLTRTRSLVSMIAYMRLLWSNFCIYAFMLLFFIIFLLCLAFNKIENEITAQKL